MLLVGKKRVAVGGMVGEGVNVGGAGSVGPMAAAVGVAIGSSPGWLGGNGKAVWAAVAFTLPSVVIVGSGVGVRVKVAGAGDSPPQAASRDKTIPASKPAGSSLRTVTQASLGSGQEALNVALKAQDHQQCHEDKIDHHPRIDDLLQG